MFGRKQTVVKSARSFLKSSRGRLLEKSKRGVTVFLAHIDYRPYSNNTNIPNDNPGGGNNVPLFRRLVDAWRGTSTKWYPLPVAVGALLLIVIQYRRRSTEKEVHVNEHGQEVVRLKGPWQVYVLGSLPLRNLSRVWGYVNSLELPVWLRPVGFRIYARIFGCDLSEIDPEDLTQYASLGDFFYRKLKDGARPTANAVLVSPADGKVLHFGTIIDGRIEQIKGSTYSLEALLGAERPGSPRTEIEFPKRDMAEVHDRSFADINGIEYSLQDLLGTSTPPSPASSGTSTPSGESSQDRAKSVPTISESPSSHPQAGPSKKHGPQIDASVSSDAPLSEVVAHEASVAAEIGVRPFLDRSRTIAKPENTLFFVVIYLAPGDYHRFHSPAAWVVEKRRHFVGDLFSVSPWMVKRLPNLFVLNERVALLGRWKHGFFGMIPVGATNVGSIKIDFDQALRTNVGSRRSHPIGTYTEAVYSAASPVLKGQPLTKAEEMGGFCLGSTIVLVFEAPKNFEFAVNAGQKIKVGEKLGDIHISESSAKQT
ncbi:hypothetical protein AcW1_000169 [Taiwanofungus camphoratus]|nr:hypothetical protein AcW2_001337 [Antrodia cinnamomea]KAI0935729.1 hypothetical protein AcV5_004066 [Antrodia cinnamomea]KAI0962951.1 hypothetical protein AcW1_000169 [Antrodia cinnamomea]